VSETEVPDLFAPPGGWRVHILDNSGGAEGGITEEVAGFPTLMLANEFARRYVRDSLERCRVPGQGPGAALEAWRAYGEDAGVPDAAGAGWESDSEIADFAERPANAEERDWRALDPRALDPDGEAEAEPEE